MPSIAIVGASADRRKYGNKAVRAFLQGGWTVYPVNPGAAEIEGLTAHQAVADKKPREFFLNPGSESPELIAAARALGLEPILACSIVNIGLRPDMFPDA